MDSRTSQFTPVSNEELAFMGTEPVAAARFYRPEYFELERKAIFRRVWLPAGRVSELAKPGSFIVRPIAAGNASVLMVHGPDEKLRAFHNVCSHRGTQLVQQPAGAASSFSCPYHMWTYGYDGTLRGVPDAERFYQLDKSKCGLKEVAIDTCAGFLFVNLDPSPAQSLHAFLGPLAEQLEALSFGRYGVFTEYTYDIQANWKVVYDNFQDFYHLRAVHPRSWKMRPENPFGYPLKYSFHGPHRSASMWTTDSSSSAEYFGIFPNLLISGSPGLPFSHEVWPLGADRSRGLVRIYWEAQDRKASQRFGREYAMTMLLEVHSEDHPIIESAHRGLNSGAVEFIHFQAQEVMSRHFYNVVIQTLQTHEANKELIEERIA